METFTPDRFDGQVLRRPGRYAVVFTADWCPFCRSFLPEFSSLAGPGFDVARVDLTDLSNPLWEQFEVEVVPTVIVFREGRITLRVDGVAGVGLGPRDVDRARAAATS